MRHKKIAGWHQNHNLRLYIEVFICVVLFVILIYRLYVLQIANGTDFEKSSELRLRKERTLRSSRGNIYDRNGAVLATNKFVYNITVEDNGDYKTTRQKQLTLNSIAYRIITIVNKNHEVLNNELPIILDNNGKYQFKIDGTSLERFLADVYGRAKIEQMTKEEANASASDIINYLCSEDKFALYKEQNNEFTKEERMQYKLEHNFSKEMVLNIVGIRYMMHLNSFQRYLPITVATDVSDKTIAYILENNNELPGVDIAKEPVRNYEGGEAFAHILGYTGNISPEELVEKNNKSDNYSKTSIVGKTGIEQYMDSTLKGTDGKEMLYVNNVGKVMAKKNERTEPVSGKNVYLSIDKNLQIAAYKILEQQLAGILLANIRNIKEFDESKVQDASEIIIPISDVYYSLINNNIIDCNHFEKQDASRVEKEVYQKFITKQKSVLSKLSEELVNKKTRYKNLDTQMQAYQSYVVNELLQNKLGILSLSAINKKDSTYLAWTKEETISMKDYLTYAINKKWIDLTKIPDTDTYMDSEQAYQAVVNEILKQLPFDKEFNKKIYGYMLRSNELSGNEICQILCDQGVLSRDDTDYRSLIRGEISAYQYIRNKIKKLEITPAQLAPDPCSGSVVITKPKTGEVLACVTYPGYDNNRLANKMDSEYYRQLLNDKALPLYNRATQQLTAPGSTFKPITAIAGLQEQVIKTNTRVDCDGIFDKLDLKLHCWNRLGHGEVTSVASALKNSCNDYFCEIAYRLGLDGNHTYLEKWSLKRLQKYAKLFNLNKKSGIELTESTPHITNQYAIPSSIGQGTHNYATVQLARYVTSLANEGTSYQLSILDKVTNQDGTLVKEHASKILSNINLPKMTWAEIREGMKQVVQNNRVFTDLKISAAGKTGTAEEVKNRPNHGLFIGYAPVDEPKIAVAVRIANGYSSGNAAEVAKDIFNYYFNLKDKHSIVTGRASKVSKNAHID